MLKSAFTNRICHVLRKSFKRLMSSSQDEVLIETFGSSSSPKALITLNRPNALNSLNLNMIRQIYPAMKKWEENHSVNLVVMRGSGPKAFCAGGDIKAVTEAAKVGDPLSANFFKEEYILNNTIGTYSIPFVALIDGITMGGGVGLSVHGMYRVATEKTLFAMPETAIGLFPDVGGSYFLPRLGGELGTYLALTGYRLKGIDVLKAGIATHYVNSSLIDDLQSDLFNLTSPDAPQVGHLLDSYQDKTLSTLTTPQQFSLHPYLSLVHDLFAEETVEKIIEKLNNEGSEWSKQQVHIMNKMSPTSMKITLRILREGLSLSLQDCFMLEYRLSQRCVDPNNPDFFEGVRAVILEKDNAPKWNPSTLGGVTPEKVGTYFQPLPNDLLL